MFYKISSPRFRNSHPMISAEGDEQKLNCLENKSFTGYKNKQIFMSFYRLNDFHDESEFVNSISEDVYFSNFWTSAWLED